MEYFVSDRLSDNGTRRRFVNFCTGWIIGTGDSNAEIQEIFETTVMKWFSDSAKTWSRQILFDAVWKND